MKDIYRKLFLDGEWAIAFRINNTKESVAKYYKPFTPIKNSKDYWFADPMVVSTSDEMYLFCEAYDRNKEKGVIGVFQWVNNNFENYHTIIEEDYHLSYPCVFEDNGSFYMIPESGENRTLDLYKAVKFPYHWEKVKTLEGGRKYADPTVFSYNEKRYLYVYIEENGQFCGFVYQLDLENLDIMLIKEINYDSNCGRPAGCFFWEKGKFIRPAQENREIYGKSILFYQIDFTEDDFIEKLHMELDSSNVNLSSGEKIDRIHTFNTNNGIDVIDYNIFYFDLFKRFKILRRQFAVKKRNN